MVPMLVQCLLLMIAVLMIAVLTATPSRAHVFESSRALVFFDRGETVLGMHLEVNIEAIVAGVDPLVKDTNDSPQAAEYDRLRQLSPEDLAKAFEPFKAEMFAAMRMELDGVRIEPTITSIVIDKVGDLSRPRRSSINMSGELLPGAKVFTFGWAPKYGRVAMRTNSQRARNLYIEILEPGATSTPLVIDDLKDRSQLAMIGDFVKIGFEHIVPKGLDHILFVVGLFLLSIQLRPILTQVTSFTVAHTITLGLGTLGVVNLPAAIVEPLIAASIVYVAVENIWRPTLSPWRPLVVFLFGLLHGLGFAGILREFNIPQGEFLVGLLSFNVGVELGQLTVIGLCFLLVGIWFGNRPWYRQRVVIPGSLVIAAIGAYWFVERTVLS